MWHQYGEGDEIGAASKITSETVLKAVSMIKSSRVYDLETERFKGIPVWSGHTGFELLAYASEGPPEYGRLSDSIKASIGTKSGNGWMNRRIKRNIIWGLIRS